MTDEQLVALVQRLTEPDVEALPDWQAAERLLQPDVSLPLIVTWEPTELGVGTILDALGPAAGASLLDAIKASSDPVLRWGMHILERGLLDLSLQSTRTQFDALVQAGAMTAAQRDALFALSRRERHPSWAEANNMVVDARAVGLARGGKP